MKKNNWLTGSVVTITLLNTVFPAVNVSDNVMLEKETLNEV